MTQILNATINQIKREILLNSRGQYMKESNTLEGNVISKLLKRDILHNTKGQYMKD